MSVPPNSRYSQGTLTRIQDGATGVYHLTVLRTIPQIQIVYKLYTWRESDRADIVAYRELGNPTLWWSIFDINPEVLNPLDVPAGTVLRIPINPVMNQGTLLQ